MGQEFCKRHNHPECAQCQLNQVTGKNTRSDAPLVAQVVAAILLVGYILLQHSTGGA